MGPRKRVRPAAPLTTDRPVARRRRRHRRRPPRPAVRLPRPREARRRGARLPGARPLLRPAGRRHRARAPRHQRPRGHARAAARPRQSRAGPQPGDRPPRPRRRRPLRRHPVRRPAAGPPAPPRAGGGGAPTAHGRTASDAGRGQLGPLPGRPGLPALPPGRRPPGGLVSAARPDLAGRDRCGRAGRCRRRPRRASSSFPTRATSRGSAPPSPTCRTSRCAPTSVRRSATGAGSPSVGARCGLSSVPGQRRSRRWPTSGWWSSGTTATTCTSNPARRTSTSGTCCCCAPISPRPPHWSAASPAPARPSCSSRPAGPRSCCRPGITCAAPHRGSAARRRTTWPAMPRRRPPGSRGWPSRPHGHPSTRATPCWCRCPAAATSRAWRASQDRTPGPVRGLRGPLAAAAQSSPVPACRWCGHLAADWRCPECGGARLRASVVGAARTAEELGRAFPGVAVRTSGRDEVLDSVSKDKALVIATPGAEPVAAEGYGAVLLLDAWSVLTRADLRAGEEALRRWMAAAALARPGGRVVVVGEHRLPVVQALVRWDPAGAAARELADRAALGFPPATRMASVTGSAGAVADLLAGRRDRRGARSGAGRGRRAGVPAGAALRGPGTGRGPEGRSRRPERAQGGAGAHRARSAGPGLSPRLGV